MQIQLTEVKEFLKKLTTYDVLFCKSKKEIFIKYYQFAFDELPKCDGCSGDIEMAIEKLKWLVSLHHTELLSKSKYLMKYTMKNDVIFYSSSMNMMVSRFNCTDAIAVKIIAENANNILLFDVSEDAIQEINVEEVKESKSIIEPEKKRLPKKNKAKIKA